VVLKSLFLFIYKKSFDKLKNKNILNLSNIN
jgi:hypothetical protein